MRDQIDLVELARRLRVHSIRMTHRAQASHVGSSLSTPELLAVLYKRILRVDSENPDWPERDRFILSKGHGCAAYYVLMCNKNPNKIQFSG